MKVDMPAPKMPEDVADMVKKAREVRVAEVKEVAEKDDIESTKKVFRLVGELAVYITQAVKRGWKTEDLFYLMQVLNQVVALVREAKMILPELKDLDKAEVQELTGMLYDYLKEIIDLAMQEKKEA